MDPPTHVENLRSGGAVMRIFRFFGACFRTFLFWSLRGMMNRESVQEERSRINSTGQQQKRIVSFRFVFFFQPT